MSDILLIKRFYTRVYRRLMLELYLKVQADPTFLIAY
jgi:hypothetical protein